MNYDFTTIMDRKGKDAIALEVDAALSESTPAVRQTKVEEGFSILPMWVQKIQTFGFALKSQL